MPPEDWTKDDLIKNQNVLIQQYRDSNKRSLTLLECLEAQIKRDMPPHGGLGSATLQPLIDELRVQLRWL